MIHLRLDHHHVGSHISHLTNNFHPLHSDDMVFWEVQQLVGDQRLLAQHEKNRKHHPFDNGHFPNGGKALKEDDVEEGEHRKEVMRLDYCSEEGDHT